MQLSKDNKGKPIQVTLPHNTYGKNSNTTPWWTRRVLHIRHTMKYKCNIRSQANRLVSEATIQPDEPAEQSDLNFRRRKKAWLMMMMMMIS